jgi:hypothetical protein
LLVRGLVAGRASFCPLPPKKGNRRPSGLAVVDLAPGVAAWVPLRPKLPNCCRWAAPLADEAVLLAVVERVDDDE